MDNTIAIQLQTIKQKAQKLIADKLVLQKQNNQLQLNLEKQITINQEQANQLQQLQTQLKALQLLQTELPADEKKELIKSIDKHIATLQKTITILSE